ncbi:MAG: hypothetical protein J1D86_01210 [Alistipes sp.]|nr:hypothetical protein [Alistipes sp.]
MTLVLHIPLLAAFAAALFLAFRRISNVRHAAALRRLHAESFGTAVDAAGGPGISLLCGAADAGRIENLLATEYPDYEVIMTVDANERHELFAALVERFALARVNCAASHELPVTGIRALYRSRERRFRRLVLVDKLRTIESDDRNAAACYASYDYLLPLSDGCWLEEYAVERLAVEISECSQSGEAIIRTDVGSPAALYRREDVVAAGGFGTRALAHMPRRRVRVIHDRLVYCPVCSRSLLVAGLGLAHGASQGSPASRRAAVWALRLTTAVTVVAVFFASAKAGLAAFITALIIAGLLRLTARYSLTVSAPRQKTRCETETEAAE